MEIRENLKMLEKEGEGAWTQAHDMVLTKQHPYH